MRVRVAGLAILGGKMGTTRKGTCGSMQIDWIYGLLGGLLIGTGGAVYLLGAGRIMGASGIIGLGEDLRVEGGAPSAAALFFFILSRVR